MNTLYHPRAQLSQTCITVGACAPQLEQRSRDRKRARESGPKRSSSFCTSRSLECWHASQCATRRTRSLRSAIVRMAIGFLKVLCSSSASCRRAALRPAHVQLLPVLVFDLELVDRAQARGLPPRGQDLAEPLASEIHTPSSVVRLRSHGRQVGRVHDFFKKMHPPQVAPSETK
jgi:hypothetical protein